MPGFNDDIADPIYDYLGQKCDASDAMRVISNTPTNGRVQLYQAVNRWTMGRITATEAIEEIQRAYRIGHRGPGRRGNLLGRSIAPRGISRMLDCDSDF